MPPALALQQAAKQAKQRGDKFPPIDFNKACINLISIFKDENDSNCPIIVYMPLLKNTTYAKYFNPQMTKFCGTTNFNYSKQQAELLTGLPEYVMIQNKEIIWDLIREVVLSKSTTSKLAIQ